MNLEKVKRHHAFTEVHPQWINLRPDGYPDLRHGNTELDFMREFKANNLMNNLMVLLKRQPDFNVWWFSQMGTDQRKRVMDEIQKLILHELA